MNNCNLCDNCPFIENQNLNKYIFHEVHVTVTHKESFIDDCMTKLGVKPIIIDMGDTIPKHSMTSDTFKNYEDETAINYSKHLAKSLEELGYNVERIKVETVPWHEKAKNPDKNQYFEAHLAIDSDKEVSHNLLKVLNLHKSRNLLKRGDLKLQMLTFRDRSVNGEVFEYRVNNIVDLLIEKGYEINKVIKEFVLYDSNENMDNLWLNKK